MACDLRPALWEIEAVDHHAHVLVRPAGPAVPPGPAGPAVPPGPAGPAVPPGPAGPAVPPGPAGPDLPELPRIFTESDDPAQVSQARDLPAFHRALTDLSELLDVAPTEVAIARRREQDGFEAFTRTLLSACRLVQVLVDDGFVIPDGVTLGELARLFDLPVRRIVRLETLVEASAAGWPPFPEVEGRFRATLEAALAEGAAGLKTVAAYRCGLGLPVTGAREAAAAYERWRSAGSGRVVDPHLISFFVLEALEMVADRPVPLQVHTGIGDRDLTLHQADPSLLRPILEDPRCARVPVVLLHCHPFVAHASWLAGTYANVHLDLSLAMTLVPHRGPDMVSDALSLAPATKLLFGTDASRLPEGFYLATRWWREALAAGLGELVDRRFLAEATALRWAELVLAGNATRLYGTASVLR